MIYPIKSCVDNIKNITQETLYDFLRENSINEIQRVNPPVSFDKDCNPVSYWKDDIWDFSSEKVRSNGYSSMLTKKEYDDLTDVFFEELKYLSLLTYLNDYDNTKYSNDLQKKASDLSMFVYSSQMLGLNSVCELCEELKFVSALESNKDKYSSRTLENKLNVFRKFCEIEKLNFPLYINFGAKQARQVKKGFSVKELSIKYSKTKSDLVNQTLYIPYDIHSKVVSNCISILETKSKYLDKMMSFIEDDYLLYEAIVKDLNLNEVSSGLAKRKIKSLKSKKTALLIEKHELSQFKSALEIQREVRLLAISCLILILSFSGMRANELCNIKIDGFKTIKSEPPIHVIRSYETKLSGGQVVDYVTSPIIKDAFEIMIKIHSFARKYDKDTNPENLIITSKHQKLLTYGNLFSLGSHIKNFANEISLIITDNDVKESELINGPREEIKTGNIWSLSSHQFRRTLIVNFVSHRLGTINAVKQQVKHMYATMTEYYAKNSNLAETFNLNVVKEIADSIEDELLEEGVRQYKSFHYSDEILAGEKGKSIMEDRKISKTLSDKEIKQLFKLGLYKISKSLYGYCTKGNLCDKKDVIDPTFCGASCSTMVITKESALNWEKLYIKNKKLLENYSNLIIGGIPLSSAKTTMQSQNEIAKKIMNDFNIKYED